MDNVLTRAWSKASNILGETPPDAKWDRVNKTVVPHPVTVTQESALSIGVLYRTVNVISNSVTQMSIDVWRGSEIISPPSLITRPDVNEPAIHFIEKTVSSLALTGNAYWMVKRNSTGNITNTTVINPNLVTVEEDENGKLRYSYDSQFFSPREMTHLKLFRVPGYAYGVGPIQKMRNELELSLQLRDYQSMWFSSSGVPTGILKTDQPLSPEMADNYKVRWSEAMSDPTNRTAVLGSGLNYQPVYLSPKDAMFIDVANFSLLQISRMFGVPASLLDIPVESTSLTYSNAEQHLSNFLKLTLTSYLNEIETAFTELLPRGQRAEFNPTALLRLDTASRYQNYATAVQNGWLGAEEVRKIEGIQGPLPKPLETKQNKETINEQD